MSEALVLASLVRTIVVPGLIADAGDDTSRRFLEFFTAKTRNKHTRTAYVRAVAQFCAWCERHGVRFEQLQPMIVAAYIESHPLAAPTVRVSRRLAVAKPASSIVIATQSCAFSRAATRL